MNVFQLDIMTPERVFFSERVEALTLTIADGSLTVLAGHMPMAACLEVGKIRIKQNGVWREAVNSEGFLDVTHEGVTLFLQACEWPEDIDVRRAMEARHRAEERLRQKQSLREHRISKISLARAMARLRVTKQK